MIFVGNATPLFRFFEAGTEHGNLALKPSTMDHGLLPTKRIGIFIVYAVANAAGTGNFGIAVQAFYFIQRLVELYLLGLVPKHIQLLFAMLQMPQAETQ